MDFKKIEDEFNASNELRKQVIKSEPNKLKRFFKRIHHLIIFPFAWLYCNIQDYHTILIFISVFLVLSSEVWIPYLLGIIFRSNTALRHTMFSVGSACWLFWAGPFTPFMPLCIGLTILIKSLYNKTIVRRRNLCQNKNQKKKKTLTKKTH